MTDSQDNQEGNEVTFVYMGHFKTVEDIRPMLDISCRRQFMAWAAKAKPGDWLSALNFKSAWPVLIVCVRPGGTTLGPDDDSR